jgi:hypothetical protein
MRKNNVLNLSIIEPNQFLLSLPGVFFLCFFFSIVFIKITNILGYNWLPFIWIIFCVASYFIKPYSHLGFIKLSEDTIYIDILSKSEIISTDEISKIIISYNDFDTWLSLPNQSRFDRSGGRNFGIHNTISIYTKNNSLLHYNFLSLTETDISQIRSMLLDLQLNKQIEISYSEFGKKISFYK